MKKISEFSELPLKVRYFNKFRLGIAPQSWVARVREILKISDLNLRMELFLIPTVPV